MLGAYRILTALASPGQRAGLVAAIWIVFYLAFSVPVVAAGVATTHFGLHQTAVVYCAALAVLAAAAAGSLMFRRRSRAPSARSACGAGEPVRASDPHADGNGPAQPGRNAGATSTSTLVVTQNDHVAAAAYLMKHFGATALVVLDGQWPGRPSRDDHESRYRPGRRGGRGPERHPDPRPDVGRGKERARKP